MIIADPKNREEWLNARKKGIGGSDAACIIGLNKYKSNVRLWDEKTGGRIRKAGRHIRQGSGSRGKTPFHS